MYLGLIGKNDFSCSKPNLTVKIRRSHARHGPVVVHGLVDLRDVKPVVTHELVYHGYRRRYVTTTAEATAAAAPAATATAADAHETHADVVQTPSAAHNEIVLQHQPKPGRQRPQTAGAKDRSVQTGVTGNRRCPPATSRRVFINACACLRLMPEHRTTTVKVVGTGRVTRRDPLGPVEPFHRKRPFYSQNRDAAHFGSG